MCIWWLLFSFPSLTMQFRRFALVLVLSLVTLVQSYMPPEGGVFEVYQEMLSEVAGKRVSKFGREANSKCYYDR